MEKVKKTAAGNMDCAITLRPHHAMCITFFEGKGYSPDFTDHMKKVIAALTPDTMIKITMGPDTICSRCPNLVEGRCRSDEKVREFDRRTLALCGFSDGQEIHCLDFFGEAEAKILKKGIRSEVCGSCEWDGLCSGKEKARFR